jgi:hypothetical protein
MADYALVEGAPHLGGRERRAGTHEPPVVLISRDICASRVLCAGSRVSFRSQELAALARDTAYNRSVNGRTKPTEGNGQGLRTRVPAEGAPHLGGRERRAGSQEPHVVLVSRDICASRVLRWIPGLVPLARARCTRPGTRPTKRRCAHRSGSGSLTWRGPWQLRRRDRAAERSPRASRAAHAPIARPDRPRGRMRAGSPWRAA